MGYSGPEIYRRMNANPATTESLDAAQVASHELMVVHENLVGSLRRIQGTMDQFWEGPAAAQANTGMNPLISTSEEAAAHLNSAKNVLYDQNGVFHDVRGKLRPMSEQRPGANGPGDWLSIGASDAEIAAAKWDDDNRHNIRQYDSYARGTDANRGNLAPQYPVLNTEVSGITTGATPGSGPITKPGTVDVPGTGGSPGGIPGPSHGGAPYSAPAGYMPPPASGGQPPAPQPPPSAPQPPASQPPAASYQPPSNSTSASGFAPPSTPPTSGFGPGYGAPGFGPTGSQPGVNYNSGTGFGPTGGGGRYGSGFGPRGSGGGAGTPGGGQQLGAGRSTGAGPHGPAGQPAPRTGPTGGSSGSSSGGRPMMGGAGAGKGQGGEDETHERKFVLPDDDPDDLFGGTPAGVKVVPPVIGD